MERDPNRISCRPSDAESTGLIDNFDGTIIDAETMKWDYNGARNEYIPALKAVISVDGEIETKNEQYYSAGSLDRLVPSEDGTGFMRAKGSNSRGLSDNCNLQTFLRSLVDHKFPEEKLDNLKSIIGIHGHFERVPQQERRGLEKKDERKKTVLVMTSIDKMPWESKPNPIGFTPKTVASVPAPAPNGDLNTAAIAAVVVALKAKDEPIAVNRIGIEAYQKSPGDTQRKQYINYCKSQEFLNQPNLPFEVVGDLVVLK